MALTNDQVTAKNFKAIVDGMAPYLGAKTQTISETAFEQLSQAEKDNGTAYFVPDATPVTNFMVMGNRFDKANIYTADERMVGSYLGKPLYQKTWIELNISCQGNAWTTLPFTIADCETIIDVKMMRGSFNSLYTVDDIQYVPSLNTIEFVGHETRNDIHTITLQYTKSSDGIVNIGTGNDYSTDEQIIGTWIDGKPLYQKTVVYTLGTVSSNGTQATIMPYDSNIIIYDFNAVIKRTNGSNTPFYDNYISNNVTYYQRISYSSDNGLFIQTNITTSSNGTIYVTLRYTKTTD